MSLIRPNVTYPGVYVVDTPSPTRGVASVPTSTTAFVGRFARGPVDAPTELNSLAAVQSLFEGLVADAPCTYALWLYFNQGGSSALVVRAFESGEEPLAAFTGAAAFTTSGDEGEDPAWAGRLIAASPGAWSKGLEYSIEAAAVDDRAWARAPNGWTPTGLMNLTLTLGADEEVYPQVSPDPAAGPLFVGRVLADRSRLAAWRRDDQPAAGTARDSLPLTESAWGRAIEALATGAPRFQILQVPPDAPDADTPPAVNALALATCEAANAFLVLDAPVAWDTADISTLTAARFEADLGVPAGTPRSRFGAVYFPRLRVADPLANHQPLTLPPGGAVAGIYARTDSTRGVWKAPAGTEATIEGVPGLSRTLSDEENGAVNAQGINALRTFASYGSVVWGARTLAGGRRLDDDYRYVPVRRLMSYIERATLAGLEWTVFEPNAEPLWAQIRADVTAFLNGLQNQGAFSDFRVQCDGSTTTPEDIARGTVNVTVGIAAVRPAEYVVVYLQLVAVTP